MTSDIDFKIEFQHIMSHTFPGFFSAITLFMLIDVWSPMELTSLVIGNISGLLSFVGLILIIGTIFGIIIDGIHHNIIEDHIFDKLNGYKKTTYVKYQWMRKCGGLLPADNFCNGPNLCSKCKNIENVEKEPIYVANWEDIKTNNVKLKNFLSKTCHIDASDVEPEAHPKDNTITISNLDKTISLELKDSKVILKNGGDITDIFIVKTECGKQKIYRDTCPILVNQLTRHYSFKTIESKVLELNKFFVDDSYSYSEFYSNTFLSLIPFSWIVPSFLFETFEITWFSSAAFGLFSFLLAWVCLYCSYFSYINYAKVVNSVMFGYINTKKESENIKGKLSVDVTGKLTGDIKGGI